MKGPRWLADGVLSSEEGRAWAEGLPARIERLEERWSITALEPIGAAGNDGSGSWIAGCTLADGSSAVLKLTFPHLEGRDEMAGLAFWAGEPTVRLLAGDAADGAMLLERCLPGSPLKRRPEPEQDTVLAGLLRRLWREPAASAPFRPLAEQIAHWCAEARGRAEERAEERAGKSASAPAGDVELVRALDELTALAEPAPGDVLLATDLHAGNVLAARRVPWLVIDPKPFVGDPAYDVTQHLLNCPERLAAAPDVLIERVAGLAGVDAERVGRWLAARLVAGTAPSMDEERARAIARRVARPRRVSSSRCRDAPSRAGTARPPS